MSIIGTRRDQMFPVLDPAVIERLRRFGEVRSYRPGEALVSVGDAGHGLTIILAGKVDIREHEVAGPGIPITSYSFSSAGPLVSHKLEQRRWSRP
jgi:thioredoxin reductase (NADPH)